MCLKILYWEKKKSIVTVQSLVMNKEELLMVCMQLHSALDHQYSRLFPFFIDQASPPSSAGKKVGRVGAVSVVILYIIFIGCVTAPIIYWLHPEVTGWYMCMLYVYCI